MNFGIFLIWSSAGRAQESVCARVAIRLDQRVVMTRTAFRATLKIANESPQPLSNVSVVLNIRDTDGLPANSLFGIANPVVEGLPDVLGNGAIPPGAAGAPTEATAEWLLIPTDEAAPTEGPSFYTVGGTLSYVTGGNQVTIPLYPSPITVWPDAKLFLTYFLQGQVYSDNPFTPEIVEPAEPFSLGLLVRNEGFGTARNVRIMSGQPTIVDNESGLAIAFQIIGTQVGTDELSPSLNVDFGDIEPDKSAVARWRLTSTLQGRFIQYDATFEHVNSLNIPGLSLIEAVDIFELNHIVKLDGADADDLPDFLVNNTVAAGGCSGDLSGAPGDDLPDCVHSSDGPVLPVRTITSAVSDGPPTSMDQIVMVTVPVTQTGWNYIRLDDPGMGAFNLASVVRIGGGKRHIVVGDSGSMSNAWTTHRYLPIDGVPDHREDLLHIFDNFTEGGTYSYELAYVGTPNVCNNDSDCDDSDPCSLDTCIPAIGCQHSDAPLGTACGDPSTSACNRPDICDGQGHCTANLEPSTTVCRPAVGECDKPEYCSGASADCPSNAFVVEGKPCGDPENGECDRPDSCDGLGHCLTNLEPPTTLCRFAATACDVPEYCSGTDRKCPTNAFASPGTSCGDPTENACNHPDSCDGTGHCQPNFVANGVSCSDNVFCNGQEICISGSCTDQRGPCRDPQHCDEANHVCLDCISDSECADTELCTIDRCDNAHCVHSPDPQCTLRAAIEIKPGSCPTTVDTRLMRYLPVALLGNRAIDVEKIELRSLRLARSDGTGSSVAPTGSGTVRDISAPSPNDPCLCVLPAHRDGKPDLTMDFAVAELDRAMRLSSLPAGSSLSLALTGRLTNGTKFEAKDCITIMGGRDTKPDEKFVHPPN